MQEKPSADGDEASLPFEPRTLLCRLQKRAGLAVVGVALSLGGAALGSLSLGEKLYRSETLLVFKPSSAADEAPQLLTQLNLVKTRENLEAVRSKLKLTATLEQLSSQYRVDVGRNTQLLSIVANGSSPQVARNLAMALRDVFLNRQVEQRRSKLETALKNLENRWSQVSQELKEADLRLQKFTVENRVVDLDKEAQWYLQQLTSLQILYEQAQVERTSVKLQAGNIDGIVGALRERAAREKAQTESMQSLGDINIRAQRLRDLIHDDTTGRAGLALLKEKKNDWERAQRLFAKGLVSKAEVDKAQAAYENQQALSVDTPQVKEWKKQLAKYNSQAIPKNETPTASGVVLQQMTLKGFDIQLNLVTQDQKVKKLEEAISSCQKRLDALPRLQRKFSELKRDSDSLAQEKSRMESLIGEKKQALQSNLSDFAIAEEAGLPIYPFRSNRKTVFAMLAMLGLGATVTTVLLLVLGDRRVRSAKELSLWSDLGRSWSVPSKGAETQKLALELLARQLLRPGGEAGLYLLTSASLGGNQQAWNWLERLAQSCAAGLGTALLVHLHAPDGEAAEKVLSRNWKVTPGLEVLRLSESSTESLTNAQVEELLGRFQEAFGMVLLWAAPMQSSTQAERWGPFCQRLLLVEVAASASQTQLGSAGRRLAEINPIRENRWGWLVEQEAAFAAVDRP